MLLRIALEVCISILKQIARHLRMILIVDINSWYTGVPSPSWREFIQRHFVLRIAISHRRSVIIGRYVPE